jgi:hypothetical protein
MKSLLPISDMAINLRLFSFVKSLTDLCLFGSLNPLLFQNMPLILTLCFLTCSLFSYVLLMRMRDFHLE